MLPGGANLILDEGLAARHKNRERLLLRVPALAMGAGRHPPPQSFSTKIRVFPMILV